jgi:uracil-DNA glycosylase
MNKLLQEIKQCRACEKYITPNPILSIGRQSKIIIVGQAPGRIVHETGIPWNDKSGDNLRAWLGVDKPTFYDTKKFGIMPMGFCYPGTGKSGDLPPRPECAPLWHAKLLKRITEIKLIILVGQYAHSYYLKEKIKESLTETVKNYTAYLPEFFALPHPSPRNNIWLAKNKWFAEVVLPDLKDTISRLLSEQ